MNFIKKALRPLYIPIANWHYVTFRAPRRYRHLFDTIRATKAAKIMEIGVWNGKRAMEMIETAKEYTPQIEYFGFDLFEDLGEEGFKAELSKMPPTEEEVGKLIKTTGASVRLYRGNTLETLPATVGGLPKMDFIFLDGGHSIETIASDWKYVQEIMDENTIVIFDDYWRNRTDAGCKPVVDAIGREMFNVEILPEVDKFNNLEFGRLEISFAKVMRKK